MRGTLSGPLMDTPTGSKIPADQALRLGLGHARDVSTIEGKVAVAVLENDALPQERGDQFAAHMGFEPYVLATANHDRWFRISSSPRAASKPDARQTRCPTAS